MSSGNVKSSNNQANTNFLTQFGKILKMNGVPYTSADGTAHRLDPVSADFARFLRASRMARGRSKSELASQSGLSDAQIVCLENGIIHSKLIPEEWLYALAEVLEEKPSTFGMILERDLSKVSSTSNRMSMQLIWRTFTTFIGSNKILIMFFACVATLFMYLTVEPVAASAILQALRPIQTPVFYLALLLVLIWMVLVTNGSFPLQSRGFRKAYQARREIAVIFSTIVGLALLAYALTTFRLPTAQPTQPALTDIYYAAQNIPQGTTITQEMLERLSIPSDKVAEVEFSVGEEGNLVGQTARFTLEQGVIITSAMVGEGPIEISGPAWAVQIPTGMVAAAIPTNRLATVAYGVNDGAHVNVNACMLFVDVDPAFQTMLPNFTAVVTGTGFQPEQLPILSASVAGGGEAARQGRVELDPTLQQPFYAVPSEPQRPRLVCQMILQDVVVMKLGNFALQAPPTDPNATPTSAQQQPAAPDIVTLIVTPQDSISLNYFVHSGTILTMTLRNPNDTSRFAAEGATLTSLLTQYDISLPSKLPYVMQPRIDQLVPPGLPNDLVTVQPAPAR